MLFTPGSQVRWWLLWAAIPYGIVSGLRARFYQWGWLAQRKLPVPVISVGNLTLGGTGKTPIVIRLAEWLLAEGRSVAILSRGYGRTSGAEMLLVSDGTQVLAGPGDAGDEPFLIATRCPKAVVAVGADRYRLGRWVLSRFPIDCILLDDGFQHLALYRDVDILLVDATDLGGLKAVVPAGRLREPIGAAARATQIVITRAENPLQVSSVLQLLHEVSDSKLMPPQAVFRVDDVLSVRTGTRHALEDCKEKTAVLCSGIGHGASFCAMAERLGLRVLEEYRYADHHVYTMPDIDRTRAKAKEVKADLIITTEKDLGKLKPFLAEADENWWVVRLGTEFTVGEDRLRQLILRESIPTKKAEACA